MAHFCLLPVELQDMIFEAAFVRERSFGDPAYATGRLLPLTHATGDQSMSQPIRDVSEIPAELAASRYWYAAALTSWLAVGTLVVKPTDLPLLRKMSSRQRNKIISLRLHVGKVEPADDADEDRCRSATETLTKEVINLCPQLRRLELADMALSDFLPLQYTRDDYRMISNDSWVDTILTHRCLDHLLIDWNTCETFEPPALSSWLPQSTAEEAVRHINIRIKCRGIQMHDCEAVAAAIGYDRFYSDGSRVHVDWREQCNILETCSEMYYRVPAFQNSFGRRFFHAAADKVCMRNATWLP